MSCHTNFKPNLENEAMKTCIVAATALCVPALAVAGRPFVIDDARLTDAGSCQLEVWGESHTDSKEWWAVPACNPTGNLELTLGAGRARSPGEPAGNDYVFQAKTLFQPLETNGWGWGLAVGTIYHTGRQPGPNALGNTYAHIPFSFSLRDDQLIVHSTWGWMKDKASGRHQALWGVGGELKLHAHWLGTAETYGDHRGTSYGHIGLRYALIPQLVHLDMTWGKQLSGGGHSRWLSLGMSYTPD